VDPPERLFSHFSGSVSQSTSYVVTAMGAPHFISAGVPFKGEHPSGLHRQTCAFFTFTKRLFRLSFPSDIANRSR